MGFLKRLFGQEERAELNAATGEADPAQDSAQNAMLLSLIVGNEEINADTAQEIPAFVASVDFIADTIAALPVKLYREDLQSRTVEEITEDKRLVLLNEETGDLVGAFDAKRAQIRDMLIYGAGYMYINKSGAAAQSLHYVRSRDVYVQKNSDPIFKDADIRIVGRRYYPWDFIVVTRNSTDGITGRGMVDDLKTLLSATYNTLKYENIISRTGGNKKGFLQSERALTEPAMRELRRAWQELYANNGNNMMVLNNGLKYVASASTSVEMQLNQNKVTNAAQIAQGFGLSVEVISGTANTEQYMSAVRRAVLPVIKEYEGALNRSLLLESEKRTMYFAFDTTELMKGDVLSRYRAYAVGLQNNFLRLDEVRYKEDLEPLGFNYMKLGLQDVLLDPETGDIYTPNTNAAVNLSNMGQIKAQGRQDVCKAAPKAGTDAGSQGQQVLTDGGKDDIIEERARHYIRGEHGYFMGSVSDGNSGGSGGGNKSLDKSSKSGIIKSGSGKVTISSVESPIEQKHTGKGNPNAINTFDVPLNNRQQALLDRLPGYDSRVIVPRESVNMPDLSALTAKTGDEFAMFTKNNERLVVRGNPTKVNIGLEQAIELAAEGYRWSGHTHPGVGINVLMPSSGDKEILRCFQQDNSVIYNSKGIFATFGKE